MTQDVSWLGVHAYLLPYMEQQQIYDVISVEFSVDKYAPNGFPYDPRLSWWDDQTINPTDRTWVIAHSVMPNLLCPSTDSKAATYATLCNIYNWTDQGSAWIGGGGWYVDQNLGLSNYVGCAGGVGTVPGNSWDLYRGIFTNRSKVSFGAIKDGSAYTFLFGEYLGEKNWTRTGWTAQWNVEYTWNNSWMQGITNTAWGIQPAPGELDWGYQKYWMFSGEHPSRVMFGFADGAVRGVDVGIDFSTYVYLSGMRDARTVNPEKYRFD